LPVVDQQSSRIRADKWDALESELVEGETLGHHTELSRVDREDRLRQMAGPEESVRKRRELKEIRPRRVGMDLGLARGHVFCELRRDLISIEIAPAPGSADPAGSSKEW